MPTPLRIADMAELTFRDDLGILLARWLRPVSSVELRQSYEALGTTAQPARSRFWLLDLRRRSISSEDDTLWVLEELLPRLAAQLRGRVYVAFLVAPGHLASVDGEAGAPLVSDAHSHVRFFVDEGQAAAWLSRRRRHETV